MEIIIGGDENFWFWVILVLILLLMFLNTLVLFGLYGWKYRDREDLIRELIQINRSIKDHLTYKIDGSEDYHTIQSKIFGTLRSIEGLLLKR